MNSINTFKKTAASEVHEQVNAVEKTEANEASEVHEQCKYV